MSRFDAPPRVTIIVPTYNRAADVESTVTQLLRQPFSHFELWIIDQSDSPDAILNAAFVTRSCDERVFYLHLDRKGLPNARNEGLVRARGEFVLFVDDDVVLLTDDFIAAHVRAFDDPAVGGVTGRHVERRLTMNCKHTACYVSWSGRTIFNLFGNERQEIGSCKGSNMSFRMRAVREVGGFDRRTHLLEDTDFSVRVRDAGWRLIFEPKAELLHLSTPAGGVRAVGELATEVRRFYSTAYYVHKHRGLKGILPFVVIFSLIAVARSIRFRNLRTIARLYGAMFDGFADGRRGAEQLLPSVEPG